LVTGELVACVLFGAFLHALWNALLKKGNDVAVDSAAMWVGGAIAVVPFLFFLPTPSGIVWYFLAASIVVHVAYYIALVGAYEGGALSVAYPIMRGAAPAMLMLVSASVLGEPLSAPQVLCILGITLGVFTISGVWQLQRTITKKSLGYALLTAAFIAAYTVIDGKGARAAASPWGYAVWLMFLQGWFVLAAAFHLRRKKGVTLRAFITRRSLFGGAASILSYAIALWAMTRAPIALVAALRETSVLFATLLGAWMLQERVPAGRWLGVAMVVAGVIGLRVV
jgi:drug/metabolite transporter (DMT)-like permease